MDSTQPELVITDDCTMPDPPHRSDFINSVGQFVSSVSESMTTSISSDFSGEGIEYILAQLENTDENFHSYELVRTLYSRVETAVSALVESKLETTVVSDEDDGYSSVAKITDDVLGSQEYTKMYQTFVSELRTAVDEMLADESLLSQPSTNQAGAYISSSCSSATQYFNLDDSASSELLSVHQTGLMFMSHDQLQAIADALDYLHPVQVRIDAMHHLLHFPCGDLMSCGNWYSLDLAVREALMDDDQELASLCLKFYYRMYAAHLSNTTKFAYLGLAEELKAYFQNHGNLINITMGLHSADDSCVKLFKRFRLLNHIQIELPSFWLRYSEKVVESVVRSTFDLLSVTYGNPSTLGPVYFIAVLDPKATWFRKWMHGQYSRTYVLQVLRENTAFVEGVVAQLISLKSERVSKSSTKVDSDLYQDSSESNCYCYYDEGVLSYTHFIHSLSVVERLLLYEGGRDLFPVRLPGGDLVTITRLLLHLVDVLFAVSSTLVTPPSHDLWTFSPMTVIPHLFDEVASGNAQTRAILCEIEFVSALIRPLRESLHTASSTPGTESVSNDLLVVMGDVLSVLAATVDGRSVLLHGDLANSMHKESEVPVHTIAKFVIQSLSSATNSRPLSMSLCKVTVSWLFVCRHLYNTSDGLMVLEPYQLHTHIAKALKALESVSSDNKERASIESVLLDNLLNFAGTPKGLLLLHQSGLLSRCTHYMHHRYKLKLQVSKHEKFGYGCMVTQLASSAAGISELSKCGFVSMLVNKLWTLLNAGEDDHKLTAPSSHPLDPMHRMSHKAVTNLLNILSAYPALCEVLISPRSSSSVVGPDSPSSISDLMDMLVLVDTENKKRALLNYLEAHLFGLRIVSTLVTCLDSLLLLDSRCGLVSGLLSMQADCTIEGSNGVDSDVIVIDECSIERNRILVACYFIGGPNERVLPPHYLSSADEEYPWPLFSTYPPPSHYHLPSPYLEKATKDGTKSGLFKHLQGGRVCPSLPETDIWLKQTRQLFQSDLEQDGGLANKTVSLLLNTLVTVLSSRSEYNTFPGKLVTPARLQGSSVIKRGEDSPTCNSELGVDLVLRYGQFLGLLKPSDMLSYKNRLSSLLSKVKVQLSSQQHTTVQLNDYPGFDWFVSSVFLLFEGSSELALQFLDQFSALLPSGYLWLSRLYMSSHLSMDIVCSGLHPVTWATSHFVELVLQVEAPLVSSAIRMSGYTISQVCQHWLRQCFWNFLDWSEISLYLSVCILYGIDYQVYYCVSIFKHLSSKILHHAQEQDLMVFLKDESVSGFQCVDWLESMQQLEIKYRDTVLPAMSKMSSNGV